MDIAYMKTKSGYTNDTDYVHTGYMSKYLGISIPYLILTTLSSLSGCVGNMFVIGSVISYKVNINNFNLDYNYTIHSSALRQT